MTCEFPAINSVNFFKFLLLHKRVQHAHISISAAKLSDVFTQQPCCAYILNNFSFLGLFLRENSGTEQHHRRSGELKSPFSSTNITRSASPSKITPISDLLSRTCFCKSKIFFATSGFAS